MRPETLEPDALLVERIAVLSDRSALAELHARHGMTLYAVAYTVVFDPEAAEAAVAAAFREAWLEAASFDPRERNAGRWLADFTRRAARRLPGSVTTRRVPLLVA